MKIKLMLLALVCIGLTGCGASLRLHPQNQSIATIIEKEPGKKYIKWQAPVIVKGDPVAEVFETVSSKQFHIGEWRTRSERDIAARLMRSGDLEFYYDREVRLYDLSRNNSSNLPFVEHHTPIEKLVVDKRYQVKISKWPMGFQYGSPCGYLGKLHIESKPNIFLRRTKKGEISFEDEHGNVLKEIMPVVIRLDVDEEKKAACLKEVKSELRNLVRGWQKFLRNAEEYGGVKEYCFYVHDTLQRQEYRITLPKQQLEALHNDLYYLSLETSCPSYLSGRSQAKQQAELARLEALGY